jgi:hypothetical protein
MLGLLSCAGCSLKNPIDLKNAFDAATSFTGRLIQISFVIVIGFNCENVKVSRIFKEEEWQRRQCRVVNAAEAEITENSLRKYFSYGKQQLTLYFNSSLVP